MADFPALPFWTDAYLADTRHLTQAEHGAYLLLLMEAWRRPRCCLPDDDVLLARLSGSPSVTEWQAIKPVVMAFWTLDARACEWTQKRMMREREFVEKSRRQKRNAARKRWNKTEIHDADGCEPHVQPTPTPTPTPKRKNHGEAVAPNGADHSPEADMKRAVYEHGKRVLGTKAGGAITKAIAQCGLGGTAEMIEATEREHAIDPMAFFQGCMRQRAGLKRHMDAL